MFTWPNEHLPIVNPTFAPMDLTTAHSLWLAPLCLLLGVGMAWILYARAAGKEGFTKGMALLLAVIRTLAIAIIAFFLLEPMVRIMVREVRKPVVVIARDGSSSLLAAGDTAALRDGYRSELEQLTAALEDRFDVRSFTYGQEVAEGLRFDQADALTDISAMLREVHDRFGGPDLGAVILDGDGIYNRGRDPRMDVDKLGVPVHVIRAGRYHGTPGSGAAFGGAQPHWLPRQ